MGDPTLMILGESERRGGRPRLDDSQPSYALSTRLPENLYDRIVQLAMKHDVSVAQMTRTMLAMQLRKLPESSVLKT